MAEVNFKSVQAMHESLLQKQQTVTEENRSEFVKEVKIYIELAKKSGSIIPSTRERDQVRANLRYWANYVYSIEKTFPDTELAPSTVSEKRPVGNTIAFVAFILLVFFGAIQVFRSTFSPPVEPTMTLITDSAQTATALVQVTSTSEPVAPNVTPSLESSGINVFLSSPVNGMFITPDVKFEGTYDNLRSGWAIHVLFVRGGKYFPVEINYPIPEKPASNTWEIETSLTENDEEMSQAQSYSIVLVVSTNPEDRETLTNSSKDGIDIKSLPDTVLLFDRTATVIYRDPFTVIRGERTLVYSLSEGNSAYDLHILVPERDYTRQLTSTQNVSELSPNLSPDGTNIAYVYKVEATETYSIHVMDSNGENDVEITPETKNILENPRWSPDGNYISYAMGDSPSTSRAAWSIRVYEIESQRDNAIQDEPERLVQPYHTWLPESTSLIFEARPQPSGTTGFDMTALESPALPSHFFDSLEDDIQPQIKPIDNGYLLTYTIVRKDKKHDIYGALLYPDRRFPFDGFQIRLTNTAAGEIVRGLESASTNFPIPDPDPDFNVIYYLRNNNIYKLEYQIVGGELVLQEGKINDGERYGDLVVDPRSGQDIFGYDVGYMEAFFPILQPSATPTP